MEQPEIVIAGGGIVTNELNQILLIHRKGKWDMPKGKIELNEEIISGAKREVEEETGVKIQVVHDKPVHTYHTYTLKGKKCLKETSWYKMESYANQLALSPQLEEGIDKVVWVNPNELYIYKENCYRLIWDLLEPYC